MTDSVNVTNDLENLVAQYEAGVSSKDSSSASMWLNARSELEARWDSLTSGQAERVEAADEDLLQNAGTVAAGLAASGNSLREQRAAAPRDPEHWWWYLDVMSHVSDYYSPAEPPKAGASTMSRLLTGIEIAVLVVAVFLLGRNLLPQIIPTPSPSPFPTQPPIPTATLDAAAFDMTTATVYKAPNSVIEMPIPKGWQPNPGPDPSTYRFIYGDAQTGAGAFAVLSVIIGEPKATYESVLDVTASVDSPKAALEAFKQAQTASAPPGSTQFQDVRAAKIGKLDGSGLAFSIPGSPQTGSPDREIDLLIAPLPDGKIGMVIVQASKSIWDKGKPVMDKMIEGLVINSQAIPTATPTETPHPLRLTQTAIQQQIEALTPTAAATDVATGAATGAATGGATLSATDAATSTATATPTAAQ